MAKKTSFVATLGGLAAAGAALVAAYSFLARPWHLRWGSRDDEIQKAYPGDELIPEPKLNATHAVTIDAPLAAVWPWLAQIGQGRGGFYSYEWIENLMGLNMHNANRILPEYQQLKVGDQIPLSPNNFGLPVAVCEPEKMLVLHGDTRLDPEAIPTMNPGDFLAVTWAWYLTPAGEGATRLVERWRCDWNASPQNWLFMRVFLEPGAFIMERKMLLGIKARAEGALEGL
ncbi:MAG: SRPBCC family protein [Chloroflexota bacterium]